MHTFYSNSPVVFNAVTQESGVITGKVNSTRLEEVQGMEVSIEAFFTHGDDPSIVYNTIVMVSVAAMDTFESSVSLTSTSTIEKFQELCTLYIVSQIDGKWGLSSGDWTVESN